MSELADTRVVYHFDCDCDFISKACEEFHRRAVRIPLDYLRDPAEHDRQVAERAWDEGYEAAAGFHEGREKGHWENDFPAKGMRTWRPDPAPTSPYRAAKEEQ